MNLELRREILCNQIHLRGCREVCTLEGSKLVIDGCTDFIQLVTSGRPRERKDSAQRQLDDGVSKNKVVQRRTEVVSRSCRLGFEACSKKGEAGWEMTRVGVDQ